MAKELNFSVVANNTVSLEITVLDQDDNAIDGTGMAIKWQWFIPGMTVTKSTALGTMSIKTADPLVLTIPILATDTLGAVQGSYAHEAVTVDINGYPVTITGNDPVLSAGVGFVRKQLTVQ